jgi:hypothetical protein
MVINNLCEFLHCSVYNWKTMANLSLLMAGATPYEFLKVPWVNKQLVSSGFTFRTRKKAAGVKYGR